MNIDASTLQILLALIGSQAIWVTVQSLISSIAGKGKRERQLRRELLAWEETAIAYRRLSRDAGLDITDWPKLPE